MKEKLNSINALTLAGSVLSPLLRRGKAGGFLLLFLLTEVTAHAQIGGNLTPLQYSIHTYSIEMDDVDYDYEWGLYPAGTTQSDIEESSATALVDGTDYTFIEKGIDDGQSYFKIQFSTVSGPLAQGTYVIGYLETTSDDYSCATAEVLEIEVKAPFDVDIALADTADAQTCPDESGELKTDTASQTQIEYRVTMTFPDEANNGYVEGLTWNFSFQVEVTGDEGDSATIETITASATEMTTDETWTPTSGSSSYSGNLVVDPSQTDTINFIIVYNDVLGVDQDITFQIEDVIGAYSERDIDEIDGDISENSISNIIYAMPDVGIIEAWN